MEIVPSLNSLSLIYVISENLLNLSLNFLWEQQCFFHRLLGRFNEMVHVKGLKTFRKNGLEIISLKFQVSSEPKSLPFTFTGHRWVLENLVTEVQNQEEFQDCLVQTHCVCVEMELQRSEVTLVCCLLLLSVAIHQF